MVSTDMGDLSGMWGDGVGAQISSGGKEYHEYKSFPLLNPKSMHFLFS